MFWLIIIFYLYSNSIVWVYRIFLDLPRYGQPNHNTLLIFKEVLLHTLRHCQKDNLIDTWEFLIMFKDHNLIQDKHSNIIQLILLHKNICNFWGILIIVKCKNYYSKQLLHMWLIINNSLRDYKMFLLILSFKDQFQGMLEQNLKEIIW